MNRSSPLYRSGLWFCLVADMSGLLVIPDKPFSAVLMSSHPNPVRGARARGGLPMGLPSIQEPVMDTDNTKPWYLSRGVIGSAVAIGAGVAAIFNYQIDADLQASIAQEVLGFGSLAGGALALCGRIKASRKIG